LDARFSRIRPLAMVGVSQLEEEGTGTVTPIRGRRRRRRRCCPRFHRRRLRPQLDDDLSYRGGCS